MSWVMPQPCQRRSSGVASTHQRTSISWGNCARSRNRPFIATCSFNFGDWNVFNTSCWKSIGTFKNPTHKVVIDAFFQTCSDFFLSAFNHPFTKFKRLLHYFHPCLDNTKYRSMFKRCMRMRQVADTASYQNRTVTVPPEPEEHVIYISIYNVNYTSFSQQHVDCGSQNSYIPPVCGWVGTLFGICDIAGQSKSWGWSSSGDPRT